ncbi:hypothetical protein Tco_0518006 [Tanacetum coccineum]
MRSPYSQITTPSPLKILDYKSLLGFAAIDWISGVVVSISRFHYGYGNIKVFCRTRPLFEDEGPSVVEFPDDFTIRVNTGDDTAYNEIPLFTNHHTTTTQNIGLQIGSAIDWIPGVVLYQRQMSSSPPLKKPKYATRKSSKPRSSNQDDDIDANKVDDDVDMENVVVQNKEVSEVGLCTQRLQFEVFMRHLFEIQKTYQSWDKIHPDTKKNKKTFPKRPITHRGVNDPSRVELQPIRARLV